MVSTLARLGYDCCSGAAGRVFAGSSCVLLEIFEAQGILDEVGWPKILGDQLINRLHAASNATAANTTLFTEWVYLRKACHDKIAAHPYQGSNSSSRPSHHTVLSQPPLSFSKTSPLYCFVFFQRLVVNDLLPVNLAIECY